ncbi:uncharacterized protein TEOVI_000441100 [Trypanosoma equiperdum]|uniref:Sfi1 spindle body protein n=1 Tax=Trypanosoma equiperdum TaxID=5694 RepID=A0A1G4IKF0_TRYEQ|nr:hypothetical protein, conserved [Trypanosoma equiperdum]
MMSANNCTPDGSSNSLLPLKPTISNDDADMRRRWTPLLNLLAVDSEAADGTPASLMIVAHVTYRSSLLRRALRLWVKHLEDFYRKEQWREHLASEWYGRRRLFLFFRAWQWRYNTRLQLVAKGEKAQTHCLMAVQRRAWRAWATWLFAQRAVRKAVSKLLDEIRKGTRLRFWLLWRRFSTRRVAYGRVVQQMRHQHLLRGWMQWRRLLLRGETRRLLSAVITLYTPCSWMHDVMASFQPALARQPVWLHSSSSTSRGNTLGEWYSFKLIALRFYFIQWMGETASRRGRRLLRYESAVQTVKRHVDMSSIAGRYHTWLLYTANNIHRRRILSMLCRRYFRKWTLFVSLETLFRQCQQTVYRRVKLLTLLTWRGRAQHQQEHKNLLHVADAFCARTLQEHQRRECFVCWRARLHSREEFRRLEAEVRDRRMELLRDLAVNRLLHGVLLNFCEPPNVKAADPVGGRHSPSSGVEEKTANSRKVSERYITITPNKRDGCNASVEFVEDGSNSPRNPVDAFRRKLMNQPPAIPLGFGSVAPRAAVVAQPPAHRLDSAPSVEIQSMLSTSSTLAPADLTKASPPSSHLLSFDPLPATSEDSNCTTSRPDVAEGRRLLTEYRVMLATAPSEREEMRIVRSKLDLYKLQRQRGGGLLNADDEQAEKKQVQRLISLKQRELDRQALRARVEQLAKHLEVVLRSSSVNSTAANPT